MKKFFLIWGLSLMCFSGFATSYIAGNEGCANFEAEEKAYYEEENIHVTLVYAICLLVKGEATNNPSDVTKGMAILHELSDQQSNVPASYFIAEFHLTGGTFDTVSYKNLDIALNYFFRTLAIIDTFHNYPPSVYTVWEEKNNMEMLSHYKIPFIYLDMFYFGVAGDYILRILNSPSYEGTRDLETYPKYNKNIMSNINSAIDYARQCKSLPQKRHFSDLFPYYKEICAMYEEKAILLKDIQWKRHQLLSEERCKDVGTWDKLCPEINELNTELKSVYESILEEQKRILHPVRDRIFQSST